MLFLVYGLVLMRAGLCRKFADQVGLCNQYTCRSKSLLTTSGGLNKDGVLVRALRKSNSWRTRKSPRRHLVQYFTIWCHVSSEGFILTQTIQRIWNVGLHGLLHTFATILQGLIWHNHANFEIECIIIIHLWSDSVINITWKNSILESNWRELFKQRGVYNRIRP